MKLTELPETHAPAAAPPPTRETSRQFQKLVKQSPVSPEARSDILSCYKFEDPQCKPDDVIDKVEKLLGYQGWPWAGSNDRAHWIRYKVGVILNQFLRSLGFHTLTHSVRGGKHRLVVSPLPGAIPSPLPYCLSVQEHGDFIDVQPSQDIYYEPEGCINPLITDGSALLDSTQKLVGSVSCLMKAIKSNKLIAWTVPTAGHILDDLARELYVARRDTGPSFRDDCALLIVDHHDLQAFHYLPNVNPFALDFMPCEGVNICDPLSVSRYDGISVAMALGGILVFKSGASTDLTMGRLIGLVREVPEAWYDAKATAEDLEDDEWMGVVQWINDIPFSSPGDSGSLVYAMEGGNCIPLGIHVGAEASQHLSYFISLETFCYFSESEGWELHIAS